MSLEAIRAMRPRVASQPPLPSPPAPPLIADTGNAKVDAVADCINQAAAPFQNAPDPEKGTLGQVENGIGAVMGVVGAPFQLLDTGFAMITAPLASMMPAFPAATLMMPHLGPPHAHGHPPSLVPPAPPVPLPSIGTIMVGGAVTVLIGGVPAARAGDIGMAPTCVGLFPFFDIFTGSSNTWIGGARAARQMDITWHCNPASAMNMIGKVMGGIGVLAGAVSAGAAAAAGQAAAAASAAAQAAADAAALAMGAMLGKDPGIPPTIGAIMMGNPMVLIGGFPMPDVLSLLGGALKALKKFGKIVGKSKAFGKMLSKLGLCNAPGEPVNPFTGEVYNDFEDYVAVDTGLSWERHYRSGWTQEDGPMGFGTRHFFQRPLTLLRKRALYETHDNEKVSLEKLADGSYAPADGFTLKSPDGRRFELTTDRDELLVYQLQPTSPPTGRLDRYKTDKLDVFLYYDGRGRLAALSESAAGNPVDTHFLYNADGRIQEVRRGVRNQPALTIARYVYHDGCLVEQYDALGAVKRFRYDGEHRMVQGTDRRGYSFHWHYDAKSGRCIKSHGDDGLWGIEVDYQGAQTVVTEADGGQWVFKHYPDGVISHIAGPDGGVMQYVKDEHTGRITKQIMPGGSEFRWLYDRAGRHYARSDQWAHQFLPEDDDPNPPDPLAHAGPLTHKGWLWGRPLERLLPPIWTLPAQILQDLRQLEPSVLGRTAVAPLPVCDAAGRAIEQLDAEGNAERYQRDAEGNAIAIQDRAGNWSRRQWTSWNLLESEETALGGVVRYAYNHRERLTALTDPNGNWTEYTRDHRQRVVEERRNGRVHRAQTYDLHGQVVEQHDGQGTAVQKFEVGDHGLPMVMVLNGGDAYSYDYDAHGRPIAASSSQHEVTMSHLRSLRQADRRDGKGVEHAYGSWQEVIRTTYFDRFVVRYDYRNGPGVYVHTPDGNVHHLWRTPNGLVVRENANGTNEVTLFDAEQRLRSRHCWSRIGGEVTWRQVFRYSAVGELQATEDSDAGYHGFEYDADHRLTAEVAGTARREYAYDRAGNIVRTPEHGLIHYKHENVIAHADFDHFEYDAELRRSAADWQGRATVNYRYDSRGQLIEAHWSDHEQIWKAAYDGLGRRLWKQYADERVDFYWDGDRLAAERFADGQLRIYVYSNEDALVPFMWLDYASDGAEPSSGKAYYLFVAPNGMPLRVEDCDRNIAWRVARATAYGLVEVAPGSTVDLRLRFAGHFYDEHLQLFYNRYRDYDPKLGRYLQPDPIGHDGGVNLYAYPANPLADVDLLGLVHRRARPKGDTPEGTQALKDDVRADVASRHATLSRNARDEAIMVAGVRNKRTGDTFTADNAEAFQHNKDGKLNPVMQRRVEAQGRIIDAHEDLYAPPPKGQGKTSQEIHDMADAEIRDHLSKKGVPPDQDGMDTTEQFRRTNDRVRYREDSPSTESPHEGLRRENGNHGEVKATSDALDEVERSEGRPATGKDIEDLELHNQRLPSGRSKPIVDDAMPRCDNCRGLTDGVEPSPALRDAEAGKDQRQGALWDQQ